MAVFHEYQSVISFPAAGDLSGFQFYPVTLTTAGQITTIGSTATAPLGVLQDAPDTAGEMAAVVVAGPSKCVVYSGTIARLDALGVDTSSRGVTTTTDNRFIVGRALEATTDDGNNQIIEILVDVGRY